MTAAASLDRHGVIEILAEYQPDDTLLQMSTVDNVARLLRQPLDG
ncbi:hypothetical protein AB0F49_24250 [Micromonospora ureilytica]